MTVHAIITRLMAGMVHRSSLISRKGVIGNLAMNRYRQLSAPIHSNQFSFLAVFPPTTRRTSTGGTPSMAELHKWNTSQLDQHLIDPEANGVGLRPHLIFIICASVDIYQLAKIYNFNLLSSNFLFYSISFIF